MGGGGCGGGQGGGGRLARGCSAGWHGRCGGCCGGCGGVCTVASSHQGRGALVSYQRSRRTGSRNSILLRVVLPARGELLVILLLIRKKSDIKIMK